MSQEAAPQNDTVPLQVVDSIRRTLEIQKLIDPGGQLPKLKLQQTPTHIAQEPPYERQRFFVLHDAALVGQLVLVNGPGRERNVEYVDMDRNIRDRFNLAAYLTVITDAMIDGYSLRTHRHSENRATKELWENFVALGVARTITGFTPLGEESFVGHCVIDSPQAFTLQTIRQASTPVEAVPRVARHAAQP